MDRLFLEKVGDAKVCMWEHMNVDLANTITLQSAL